MYRVRNRRRYKSFQSLLEGDKMINKTIKLLKPAEAVQRSDHFMASHGFYKTTNGKDSRYFARRGSPFRIRISDHTDPHQNTDVLADVIFDYDTIINDVEVRCGQAVKQFERNLFFRKNRKNV